VIRERSLADVRGLLHRHGYHLFVTQHRDEDWWVAIRDGDDGLKPPVEARAATRDEAIVLAERLFITHRLSELDGIIRRAGLIPPFWGPETQAEHLQALAEFATAHGLIPPPSEGDHPNG
jgi:hypothetical protein